jgi:hypothetical protein
MSADRKAAARLENVIAMLGSAHDGERANAALMATRMLNELGLDWRGAPKNFCLGFLSHDAPLQTLPSGNNREALRSLDDVLAGSRGTTNTAPRWAS